MWRIAAPRPRQSSTEPSPPSSDPSPPSPSTLHTPATPRHQTHACCQWRRAILSLGAVAPPKTKSGGPAPPKIEGQGPVVKRRSGQGERREGVKGVEVSGPYGFGPPQNSEASPPLPAACITVITTSTRSSVLRESYFPNHLGGIVLEDGGEG